MKFVSKASLAAATLLLFLEVPLPTSATAAEKEEDNLLAGLKGVVIDSRTRQPVAEALVSLERGRNQTSLGARGREAALSTVTDQRGRFRFNAVEPGVYTLVATKRGYVSLRFHVLELGPGKTTTRDVVLDPLAKVSGRVVDDAGHALKGARVGVVAGSLQPSPSLSWLLEKHGMSALSTTTDNQAKFELFVPAEEGKITLLAGALGYATNRVEELHVEGGRERKGVVLRLSPGLDVGGRVVDELGAPLSGATIVALSQEPGRYVLGFEEVAPRSVSGPDGSFLLSGMEEGAYTLKVTHATHASRTIRDTQIEETTSQIPDIVLQPPAEVSGRVTDTAGQPIASAIVSGGRAGEESSAMVLSDGDGQFVLREFAGGESIVVIAEAPGYVQAKEIVTAPQTDVALVVRPHGVFRGRVEDFDTKGPVKEFQIWMERGLEQKSFRSEDGTFEWHGLPPGRWTFFAQAPGYQNAELREVEIHSGEPTEGAVFLLRKGVELAGRVVDDETDKVLSDVTVAYRDASEPEDAAWLRFTRNKQTTDAEGNFKFEGVPPVKVTVTAYSPLYAEERAPVMAGEEDFVEIRLRKGASLSGRVVALDGVTAVPEAQVSLWSDTSSSGTTIPADGAGVFSFDRLNPGRYRLTAEATYGQTQPLDIVLQENEHLGGLALAIRPGATLRGKASGMMPGELPVVNIVANGGGGFTAFASTDADGAYAIHGVPAGVLQMMASTSSFRVVRKSVEVPEGVQELTLDIEFPPPARLYGRVTRAGQPVSHTAVIAVPVDPQLPRASKETDQDGLYAIDGLSDGNYAVSLAGTGVRKSVRISGDTLLDIELPPSSISGRVVEASSGEAIPGAGVQLRAVGEAGNAGGLRTGVSDTLGRFSIEGIEAGDYEIVAHKPGFRVKTQRVSVPVSAVPIELTLFLTPGEGVDIRVRDGISGLGLGSVAVNVYSGPVLLRMDVGLDETGRGELPQLPSGTYNVLLSAQGYAAKAVSGWIVPGSGLDLFLTPGGRLEIQVDPAYVGARATLQDPNGVPYPPTASDPSFALSQPTVFRHLSPGEYALSVRASNGTKTYRGAVFEGQTTVLHVK